MQTRVKERLVGAIALVAIVVVVVPEVLTGQRGAPPPAPAAGSTPLRRLSIDLTSSERYSIDRSKPQVPPVAVEPAASAPPAPAPPAAAPAPEPTPAADVPPSADASVPQAATAAPAVPVAVAAPAPKAGSAAPARPVTRSSAAWVVQLASFASRENAEHFAASLRAKGYAAFVKEFTGSGRVLFRVRVGPEQDRARADALAVRLKREGHAGSVAPEP